MDAETIDLLVSQIDTQWDRPLLEFEKDQWRQLLTAEPGEELDPEFVAEAILLAKHSPIWQNARPDLESFASFYRRVERAHQAPPASTDPGEQPATAETVTAVLAEARKCLSHADEVAENLARERSRLLHAMTRADIDQGTLL